MSEPSLDIRRVEKVVVMSDLHLGEEECILNPNGQHNGHKNINDLVKAINGIGKVDELILLGDFIDLALASIEEAYSNAKEFFSAFEDFTTVKERITYVPGNHDHHVWVQLIEQQEVVEKLDKGQIPDKKDKLTERSVRTILNGTFLEKFLEKLLPPKTPSKKLPALEVAYPDIMRRIGNQPNDPVYYFTHGHYLEGIFTPITNFMERKGKVSLVDLEAFNCAWLEAGWYFMGQAGRLGDLTELVYEAIKDHDEGKAKKAAQLILELYFPYLEEDVSEVGFSEWLGEFLNRHKGSLASTPINRINFIEDILKGVVKKLIKEFLEWRISRRLMKMSKFSRLGKIPDSELEEKIKKYISRHVEVPLDCFVFGHTHKKWSKKDNHHGNHCLLLNTGAWLVTEEKDKENVGFFVIDKDGPHWVSFFK